MLGIISAGVLRCASAQSYCCEVVDLALSTLFSLAQCRRNVARHEFTDRRSVSVGRSDLAAPKLRSRPESRRAHPRTTPPPTLSPRYPIRFPPDIDKARRELQFHINSHYQGFLLYIIETNYLKVNMKKDLNLET